MKGKVTTGNQGRGRRTHTYACTIIVSHRYCVVTFLLVFCSVLSTVSASSPRRSTPLHSPPSTHLTSPMSAPNQTVASGSAEPILSPAAAHSKRVREELSRPSELCLNDTAAASASTAPASSADDEQPEKRQKLRDAAVSPNGSPRNALKKFWVRAERHDTPV